MEIPPWPCVTISGCNLRGNLPRPPHPVVGRTADVKRPGAVGVGANERQLATSCPIPIIVDMRPIQQADLSWDEGALDPFRRPQYSAGLTGGRPITGQSRTRLMVLVSGNRLSAAADQTPVEWEEV